MIRCFLLATVFFACIGCGNSQTGPEGTQQDAIEAYIEANPNVDAEVNEIDESDDGIE